MAVPAATLVTTLLQRLRDPNGLGTSRDLARQTLSVAQRFVNLATGEVIDTSTITIQPYQLVYSLSGLVPKAGKVLVVQTSEGRDLPLVPWRSLFATSRTWFRDIGEELLVSYRMGRDLIGVYPAIRSTATVTIKSAKITNDFVDEQTLTELPDDFLPSVLDLAELLLSVRTRSLVVAGDLVGRLTTRLRTEALDVQRL